MLSPWLEGFINDVIAAGGTVRTSKDGHVKVFSRSGQFVYKMRSKGGDNHGRVGRSVLRRIVRLVKEEGDR